MEIKQMDNIEAIIQVMLDEMDKRFEPIEAKLAELASANGAHDQMWRSLSVRPGTLRVARIG
jgi:hypothetical protein